MDYLPWSSAWDFVKNIYSKATYEVIKDEGGCLYHTDGRTCWVETKVKIEDEEQVEMLPVLDFRNQAITADKVTMADVNKSIKRCLVKNLSLFGLGLNLWYGEELSDNAKKKKEDDVSKLKKAQKKTLDLLKSKVDSGCDKTKLFEFVEEIIGSRNPNNVSDIAKLDEACEKISEVTAESFK